MNNAHKFITSYVLFLIVCHYGFSGNNTSDQTGNSSLEILYHESLPKITLKSQAGGDRTWKTTIRAFDWDFQLVLESNERLVAELPPQQRKRLLDSSRLYRGHIEGVEGSWVRLSKVKDKWSGMIWDGIELYIVDPLSSVKQSLNIKSKGKKFGSVIYKLSDVTDSAYKVCGASAGKKKGKRIIPGGLQSLFPAKAVGANVNLDLAVVADVQFSQIQNDDFGISTADAVAAKINVVDGVFSEQLGVQISLMDIMKLTDNGPLTSMNAGNLLDQFSEFAASSPFDNAGAIHLFTGRRLDGDTVGIAFVDTVCSKRFGTGVEEIRGGGTAGALLVAHELAHNFGSPHDNQSGSPCSSASGDFIMNPILNGSNQFSQCSISQMESAIDNSSCFTELDNNKVPSVEISSPKDGSFFSTDSQVKFVGTAFDEEDGDLKDEITWFSDRDDNLGKGDSITVTLSKGTHRIAASVKDSEGLEAVETISIVVQEPDSTILFETEFNNDRDGFTYNDDVFGGTSEPDYANGKYLSNGGFSGGGLQVMLGGIDNDNIFGMSGGWEQKFTLDSAQKVTMTLRYKLNQSGDYEPKEFSEAMVAVDDFLIMVEGKDFLAQLTGKGDGSPDQSTGWKLKDVDLGTLTAGTHSVVIGVFNNQKTFRSESTEFLIDDVTIKKNGSSPPPESMVIFENSFDSSKDNFSYTDDTFRNTDQPTYAKGSYVSKGGFNGGGLRVTVGGVDDDSISDMSGGWERSFTLDSSRKVRLSFRFKLTQSRKYDTGENSEALLSLDGKLIGANGVVARINGKDGDTSDKTTGWELAEFDLGSLKGKHRIAIGAYNNKKTWHSELTEMFIDDVILTGE